MQMQPILPSGPLVVGAKEAPPDNNGKSIDSILSSLIDTEAAAEGTSSEQVGENAKIAPQPYTEGNNATGGTDPPLAAEITTLATHADDDLQLELISSQIAALAEIETAEEIPDVTGIPSAVIATEKQQAESGPVSSLQQTISASLPEGLSELPNTNPEKVLGKTPDPIPHQGVQDTITASQTQALQPQNAVPQEGEKEIAVAIPRNESPVTLGSMDSQPTDADSNLLKVLEKNPQPIVQKVLGEIAQPVVQKVLGKVPQSILQSIASSDIGLRFPELTQNVVTNSQLEKTAQAGQQEGASLIDFQFAEILGKASVPVPETIANLVPLRQRNNWSATMEKISVTPTGSEPTAETTILKMVEELMAGNKTGSNDANLFQTNHNNPFSTPTFAAAGEVATDFGASIIPGQTTATVSATGADDTAMKLPSGLVVAENTVVDHIVKHASFFTLREGSGISIKMQPEELGNLNMKLVSDENGIKAHIQVQSQQVQDILEKHLFRLKEGFEQQGLNLHDIQVSVNSEKNSGPDFFNNQFDPQNQPQTSNTVATNESQENVIEETLVTPIRPEGIISLRI